MERRPPNQHMAILECHHDQVFVPPPAPGDELYCRTCGRWRLCVDVAPAWRARCLRCNISREYGTDLQQVRQAGLRHLRRFPAHTVLLYCGPDLMEEMISAQDPLFVTEP